jgi:iron complex outermembrane receptor protein
VRGKLRWQASDTFAIKYTGDWQETDCNCTVAPIRQVDPDPALLAELYPVVPSETNDEVNLDASTSRNTSSSGHTIDMNWDIGNFSLTSITAYRSWEISGSTDIDSRPTRPLDFDQEGATDQEQFSQELRVTSPADGFITYVAGLYYFQQSVDRTFTRSALGMGLQSDFSVDTVNYAAFGEATFNLSDRWRLITGLRYTSDQLDYKFGRTGQFGGTLPVVPPVEDGTDADDLSGKLALQWDFTDTAMTYLSYTQGYKGPAYSIAVGTDPTNLQPVDPETSDSIELGLKSSLWNNRMTLNLAAFYTRYSDWQAEAFVDDGSGEGTGAFELANAGRVLTRGIELDVTALPITNLTLYGGLALIRATIDEFDEGPCSFGQIDRGECPNDVQDLSGGDMPYSPDLRVILTANYFQPLKSLPFGLTYNGTYRWQDEVLFSVTQDEFTEQEAYGILDLSFGIRDDNEHYAITAFVKNATDNFYVDNIASVPSILLPGGYVQNVPKFARRTFGVELEYHWF